MENLEKGWLAGIIDGEGCVTIEKFKGLYIPRVIVGSRSLPMIEKIRQITNCGFVKKKIDKRYKEQPIYVEWVANSNAIRKFLPEIVDYLVVKKEQAMLILKALDLLEKRKHTNRAIRDKNGRFHGTVKNNTFLKELDEIVNKVRILNKKNEKV
jgi:hypothetical protein